MARLANLLTKSRACDLVNIALRHILVHSYKITKIVRNFAIDTILNFPDTNLELSPFKTI